MSTTNEGQSAARAAIIAGLPTLLQDALKWDRSQWADDGVESSDFYKAPASSAGAKPGDLLKVEETTDTSKYALPPATSLSRFIFQSETLDGTPVPVSGLVLWPYDPRSNDDGFQVVVWTHGTSGTSPESAPSHFINLWHHYLGPFQLALQGYVVVAPDYAGLGVSKTATGEPIIHEYLAAPAHANDAIYAFQAARSAFPQLSKKFVVIGHSQGGGAAWSVAQRQVTKPTDGYLGAVAIAPVTTAIGNPDPIRSWMGISMAKGITRRWPNEDIIDSLLTPEGQKRRAAVELVGASTAISIALMSDCELFRPDWTKHPRIREYQEAIGNGGRPIAGPLLVIQGEADELLSADVADAAVKATREVNPTADLRYVRFPGLQHVPTMTGSQRVWMDWIAEMFAGAAPVSRTGDAQVDRVEPARPVAAYQSKQNWYLTVASEFYHTP